MGHGDMMVFNANPWKWLHGYREEIDSTAANWGNIIDTRLLSPNDFEKRFVVRPETYESEVLKCPLCGSETDSATCRKCKTDRVKSKVTKDWSGNSETCKAWVAVQELNGKSILSPDALEASNVALERIDANEDASDLLQNADYQVHCTADYVDKETEITVPVRILIDIVPEAVDRFQRSLADVKTTRTASPKQWENDVFNFGYACQAGLYLDVFTAATREDRLEWVHLISENTPPFYSECRWLSQEFVDVGRSQYLSALREYCASLTSGIWRGYKSNRKIFGLSLTEPKPYMVAGE